MLKIFSISRRMLPAVFAVFLFAAGCASIPPYAFENNRVTFVNDVQHKRLRVQNFELVKDASASSIRLNVQNTGDEPVTFYWRNRFFNLYDREIFYPYSHWQMGFVLPGESFVIDRKLDDAEAQRAELFIK